MVLNNVLHSAEVCSRQRKMLLIRLQDQCLVQCVHLNALLKFIIYVWNRAMRINPAKPLHNDAEKLSSYKRKRFLRMRSAFGELWLSLMFINTIWLYRMPGWLGGYKKNPIDLPPSNNKRINPGESRGNFWNLQCEQCQLWRVGQIF